jgi:hypothetical protein
MSRLISRDPFARQELHRTRVPVLRTDGRSCAECGTLRSSDGPWGYLYRYSVQTDGGRTYEDTKLFCSVGCRRSYFGA